MHLPPIERFLLFLQTAAVVGLCFRMWNAGLHRVYAYFFTYLIAVLFEGVALASVRYGTVLYGYTWMATEALILCFDALIVLECYGTVLRDLAGLATISRRYIKLTVAIALIAALLLLSLERSPKTIFQYFYALDRAVVSSLLFFVVLMMAFLVYYPVPLSQNVVVYSAGYAVYFLAKTTGLFFRNVNYAWQPRISALLLGVSTACLVFWMVALDRRGEDKKVVIGHPWDPEDEQRLLSQLNAMNMSISRFVRK